MIASGCDGFDVYKPLSLFFFFLILSGQLTGGWVAFCQWQDSFMYSTVLNTLHFLHVIATIMGSISDTENSFFFLNVVYLNLLSLQVEKKP